jgi:hypothetical protein
MNEEKKDMPNTIDPLDHASYRAVCAELEAAGLKLALLQRDAKDLEYKKNEMTAFLCQKYEIKEGDQVLPDGKIERK